MTSIRFSIFLASIICFLTLSCKKEDTANTANTNIANIINQGTWRVSLYSDSGSDETYYFNNFSFVFSNGNITASHNSTVVTGTYSTIFDDNKNKLILNFGTTLPFDELNDDWHIIEESPSKIRLEDVSGGNGGIDLLTFEKN